MRRLPCFFGIRNHGLLSDSQFSDDLTVTGDIGLHEEIQQAATLTNKFDKGALNNPSSGSSNDQLAS
jgi:hypothetical protein